MRNPYALAMLALAGLILFGCTTQIVALPEARPGQPYTYAIPIPNAGTPPYNCTETGDSVLPGTLTFAGCTLTGNAPILLPTSSQGIYTFSFTVTDAGGRQSGPLEAKLVVTRGPPELSPPQMQDAVIGQPYTFDFCERPAAIDCPASPYVLGGMPYYSFSATGLPLGLFMKPNGELSGTVPEGANEGTVTFNLCVRDEAFLETCADVDIVIRKGTGQPVAAAAPTYRISLKAEYVRPQTGDDITSSGATWTIDETEISTSPDTMGGFFGRADVTIRGTGYDRENSPAGNGQMCTNTGSYSADFVNYVTVKSVSASDTGEPAGVTVAFGVYDYDFVKSPGYSDNTDRNGCLTAGYLSNEAARLIDYGWWELDTSVINALGGWGSTISSVPVTFDSIDGGTVSKELDRKKEGMRDEVKTTVTLTLERVD